nr:uncharacterized protein LOC129264789 isoform X1 [Lytechinus pictus]
MLPIIIFCICIQVNDNGVIYLESSVAIEARRVQPQPVLLQGSEYSLITPYWADTDPTLDGASVSYRSVSREGSGGDEAFGMADDIVRTSYMELQNFETSWLFVVTFDELGFYNVLFGDEMYTHLRNSYQVVLLTDGELSFCIFNYGSLTWTTGWLQDMLDENGNYASSDGQEGISPAQAGFSAGDNSNYYQLEGSNTQEIININRKSNINVPGRFIFRIDGATITEPFIPISALFLPYGPGMGDARIENQNDINTPDILTGQGFKFYGSVRDTLRVNDNGVIFFGQDEPNINASIPLVHVPFIAPFWADVDISSDRGVIYYRNVSRVNSSDSAFERAEATVRTSSMELQNFQSSWMFIVTWESVSYYQDPVDNQYDRLRNSFQTVLLTDGSISLSLFIYGDITWTTGVNQGGNASGLGGNEAQVGFNAGDGVKSHVLDGSYTPDVLNIDNRTNIGIPGIFIFRIDTENIAQSRCKSFGKLSINPSIGSMLGGTEVIIGGACFNSTSIIKCRFDEKVITGIVISPTSAVCVTPTFFKTGRIPLNVSVNNGSTFDFTATFTLENVEETTPGVTTTATTSPSFLPTFEVTWDTSRLMHVETVDVIVYGYSKDGVGALQKIMTLAENISYHDGSINVTAPSTNTSYEVGLFGVLQHQDVTPSNNGLDGRAGVWSEVHVLQWLRDHDPAPWCAQWITDNDKENDFIDAAPACPCTLWVAMLDFARFRRDPKCYQGSSREDNCQFRPGAVHCVRAIQHSELGGGQECCYDGDGNISNAQIFQAGGGFAHRYHHNGIRPYINATQVPFLSHFMADVLPWTYCCHLGNQVPDATDLSSGCLQYTERRPSQLCNHYVPPNLALGNGDPHIITLDMKKYTFNGHGEFILLKTLDESFVLHTRTTPLQDVNATVFIAVAAQCNDSDVIHVEINEERVMDAYVRPQQGGDFERIDFEQATARNYEGVSVIGLNISSNGILVAFEGGSGLKLMAAEGALIIQLVPHPSFREQTRGLMGTWTDDVSDDFMTPDGTVLSPNSSTEEIYFQFGLKWNVSEDNSLLYYPEGINQNNTSDLNYVPMFEATANPNINQSLVQDICNGDEFCIFDLQVTGSISFAQSTANSLQEFQEAQEAFNIVTCPTLGTPDLGNAIISRYTPGGEANYTCIEGYLISDDATIMCQSDGSWSNDVIPRCIDNVKPRVTCPGITSNTTLQGQPRGIVFWQEPTVEENSDNYTVSLVGSVFNGGDFPIGSSNINYVVTDAAGLNDTCTFIVNVTDNEDPTIQCPNSIVTKTAPSLDSAEIIWPLLNASDNSGVEVTITPNGENRNGTNFTIGGELISYIAMDSSGNTVECSFWVNVTDMEQPMITCPVIPTLPTEEGQSYAKVSWEEPSVSNGTITDNSGSAQPKFLGPGSNGGNFEIGIHVLTYLVTDEAGNSNNCTFLINVIDTEKPRITCPNVTSNTTLHQRSVGMVSWMEPTVEDNSGIFNISLIEPASNGGEYPIGVSNITYVITDDVGLMNSCTFSVVVIDNEDPTIQCPNSIVTKTAPSLDSAEIIWPLLNASDNSGVGVTITPNGENRNGTNFTIGAELISYIAMDSSGNTVECSFWVNVTDMEQPMITCPVIPTLPTEEGESYANVSWEEPSIYNGTITDNSGSAQPKFLGPGSNGGNFEIGIHVLTYLVTDEAVNSNNCTFLINVIDIEKPRITCPNVTSNTTLHQRSVGMVSWMEPTVEENSGIFNISLIEPASNGGEYPIGVSNITYVVTDDVGLMDSCTFSVVVIDNEDPTIQCPNSIVTKTAPSLDSAEIIWPLLNASDNSGLEVTITASGENRNGTNFTIGAELISYIAMDSSGNTVECLFWVNVTDMEQPMITCPVIPTLSTEEGESYANVSWEEPSVSNGTITDNSGSAQSKFLGPGSNGGNFEIGIHVLTYFVIDEAGNSNNCTFLIAVIDTEMPRITCPNTTSNTTLYQRSVGMVSWLEPIVEENTGIFNVSLIEPASNGGEYPIGVSNVTYVVTDDAGLMDSCTFSVVVIDDEDPTIQCPESIHVTTRPDLPSALVSWDDPTGSDNSGDIDIVEVGSILKGSEFVIGVSMITYVASDRSGNFKNCSFAINVTDNQDPVIRNCPSPITTVSRPGLNVTEVSWTPPKATDNSGPVEPVFIGPGTQGGNYSIGTVTGTYTVEDMSGNMDTCSFSITVRDYNDVVVICPMNVVISTDLGRASATVTWSEATNPPRWSNVTITLEGSMENGGEYPIGETSLTYFAVDPDGLNDSCTFFVVVIDEEKPNITCPVLVKAYTETNVSYSRVSWPEPTAVDNSGNVTVSLIGPGSNGGIFYIGDTNVSYHAVDDAANPSSCIVTVRVIDDESPVLTCPENISTTTQLGSSSSDAVTWYKPTGRDNSGSVTVSQITTEQNGGKFKIGVTNISYQAVDDSENNITCVFYILVEDDEPPILQCPESQSVFTQQGSDSAPVTWSEANATDNSGAVTVLLLGPGSSGGLFRIGSTNVTHLAEDDAGNNATCIFTVEIKDNEPPFVNCPSNISSTTQAGSPSSGPITWSEPVGTDNSGSVTVSMVGSGNYTNGGNFDIGVTNFTYRATDGSGNTHMCSFIIEIRDDDPPELTCPDSISAVAEQETGVATVTWIEPDVQDNSGTVTVTLAGPGANGGNFSIGMTNLSYHAVDETGNVKSCNFSISVVDPSSCISNPCLNGGTCKDFSGFFLCRCSDGFQGQTCQQAIVSCESGSNACDSTEECADSVCRCRPNFIRINGVCIRKNRYRLTLTAISLLGESLDYVDSLSDPSSDEFQSIAEDFRGVVLSITSFINDITVVQLESGSVIFTFDSFVNVSVGESVVLSDLQEALGSGSSTSDLILSPNTVPEISDFDECADATTNDCSPNANCRNKIGSFECTCYSNYNDESIGQSGSGKICVFHRSLLIAMICLAVGFTLFIVCCGALCCRWSRLQNIYAFHAGRKPDESYRPRRPHSKRSTRSKGPDFSHSKHSESSRNPSPRFTADSTEMPSECFFHSELPKSSRRNLSLPSIADSVKMAHENDRSVRSAFSPRAGPSSARKYHSNAPTRYPLERNDRFLRPFVVTGSEPTGYQRRMSEGGAKFVKQPRFIP